MKHGSLLGDIAWFAQGMAKGPVQIQETRRVGRNGYFFHKSQSYRRYSAGFDSPREQSSGPRADWSCRYEKN